MVEESPEVMDTSELPDLPELESVQYKTEDMKPVNIVSSFLVILLMLLVSGTITWVALRNPSLFEKDILLTSITAFSIFIFLLIDFVVIHSLLKRDYSWKTDPEGITVGKFLHRRYLPWDSVEKAGITGRIKPTIVFYTRKGLFRLQSKALDNFLLYLSIRQHLRKRGTEGGLPLPPEAMWFYQQVPEDIPEEMDWENPSPSVLPEAVAHFIGLTVAIWVAAIYLASRDIFPWAFAAGVNMYVLMQFWSKVVIFRRFSFDCDSFTTYHLIGRITASWSRVTAVDFLVPTGSIPPSIIMRVGRWRAVRIPWYSKHRNSTKLILGILKRLRVEGNIGPVPVPTMLLEAMADGGARSWNNR